MTDEQFELASAYLDGAASDDERARVEGDSEMLAAVEELRAISAAVADAEPPSASVRDGAIAAALAAFDEIRAFDGVDESGDTRTMPAASSPDIPSAPILAGVDQSNVPHADAVVVPMAPRRRFRLGHAVSVAAAAVVVMAGGVALLRDNAEAPTNDAVDEVRQSVAALPSETVPAGGAITVGRATTVAPANPATTAIAAPTTVPTVGAVVTQAADAEDPADAASGDVASGNEDVGSAENDATADADNEEPEAQSPSATTIPAPPAAPAPGVASATLGETADAAAAADAGAAADASLATEPAVEAMPPMAPSPTGAPSVAAAADEPVVLRSRDQFVEFTGPLSGPDVMMANEAVPTSSLEQYVPATTQPAPLPLDQATVQCLAPGSDPLSSDATYIDEDGVEHPIAVVVVSAAGEPPAFGGLDVVTCQLVVDTAEPSLVTTTSTSTTTSG